MRLPFRRLWRLLSWLLLPAVVTGVALVLWWRRPPVIEPLPDRWPALVRVVAGDGVAGAVDGPASRARFSDPFAVALAQDGSVYVSDAGEASRIRRISADRTVTTVAGGTRGYADGPGAAASFDTPSAIAFDRHGTLFVADTGNHVIRRITPQGLVSTMAGTGTAGFADGPSASVQFNGPIGVAVDRDGRVIVADTYNDRIRAILPDGRVVTIAGDGTTGATDGPAGWASFDTPCGVAVGRDGIIYVADTGNGAVRAISPSGFVSTFSRMAALNSDVWRPIGIAVGDHDALFVTDARGRIVEFDRDGAARTLAGSRAGFADGSGADARFRLPSGIAWAGEGHLFIADAGNHLVREIVAPQRASMRPPASPAIRPGFDEGRLVWAPLLWPVEPMGGPHEIAGTMGEARGDAGGEGRERFHAGIDIREEQGTPVLAVRDAVIQTPVSTGAFGMLSEFLATGDVTYVHVRVGRDARNTVLSSRFLPIRDPMGKLTAIRVRRGTRFGTGDTIGTINAFNHVHLSVGASGEEVNPLRLRLPNFQDTVPPAIARGGVRVFDEDGLALTKREKGRVLIHGRVHIVVDAWDRNDANRPQRRLGLYRLGFQVLDGGGTPVPGYEQPRVTISFARLGDPHAPMTIFAPGSGIPFYGARVTRFLYDVTSTFLDGVAEPGTLDTTALEPGPYILRAYAADAAGNEAVANRDLPVLVEAF